MSAEPTAAVQLATALPAAVIAGVAQLDPFDPALALAGHTDDATTADPWLTEQLQRFLASATSPATRRAYTADWRRFSAWGTARGHRPLPAAPLTVALYLADAARTVHDDGRPAYAAATYTRWTTSIGRAHATTGHPSPTRDSLVRATLAGIRRTHRTRPDRKRALLLVDLKALLTHLPAPGWPPGDATMRCCCSGGRGVSPLRAGLPRRR